MARRSLLAVALALAAPLLVAGGAGGAPGKAAAPNGLIAFARSPDGSLIAFSSVRDESRSSHIYVMAPGSATVSTRWARTCSPAAPIQTMKLA